MTKAPKPPIELRLRVPAAVIYAPDASIRERIQHVASRTFPDANRGIEYRFTWRTIRLTALSGSKHLRSTVLNLSDEAVKDLMVASFLLVTHYGAASIATRWREQLSGAPASSPAKAGLRGFFAAETSSQRSRSNVDCHQFPPSGNHSPLRQRSRRGVGCVSDAP